MLTNQTKRRSERGNVLFLILIAVALFAALSYVVTQSTRSGGGSTEREKNILSSAQMTQYPTALRTAIIRMVLGGVGVESIYFNPPSNFTAVSTTRWLVFHPQGGGATYQEAPSDLSVLGNTALNWTFNAQVFVPGIGIDDAGSGNDLIAFLPGVSDGVCRQVNEELGIDVTASKPLPCGVTIPVVSTAGITAAVDTYRGDPNVAFPTALGARLEAGTCTEIFDRQASGCFREGTRNVFYSVLLER